jgi:hypothetical protein
MKCKLATIVMGAIQVKGPSKRGVEPVGPNLPDSFRVSIGSRTISEEQWRLGKAAGLIKLLALAPSHQVHCEHLPRTSGTMGKGEFRRRSEYAKNP